MLRYMWVHGIFAVWIFVALTPAGYSVNDGLRVSSKYFEAQIKNPVSFVGGIMEIECVNSAFVLHSYSC